jgi:hypothetical protein
VIPTKHFLKKGRGKEEWEYDGGANLFRVHCTHVWNNCNETPSYYQCMLIEKIIKLSKRSIFY